MTGPETGQMPIVRQVAAVTYSPIPVGHIDRETWAVRVEWRSPTGWAVANGRQCLGVSGEWDSEPIPSDRTEEWLAAHRFDYDTACTLAEQQCRQVTRNGQTADEVARRAQNPPTEPAATFGDRVNYVNWQPGDAEAGQEEQAPDPGPAWERGQLAELDVQWVTPPELVAELAPPTPETFQVRRVGPDRSMAIRGDHWQCLDGRYVFQDGDNLVTGVRLMKPVPADAVVLAPDLFEVWPRPTALHRIAEMVKRGGSSWGWRILHAVADQLEGSDLRVGGGAGATGDGTAKPHRWNGPEEADWMMPNRALIDDLTGRLDPETVAELHAVMDEVYSHAAADADEAAGTLQSLREVLFSAGLPPAETPAVPTTPGPVTQQCGACGGPARQTVNDVWQQVAAQAVEALRLTREYVGEAVLPAARGWSWFDAVSRYRREAGLPPWPADPPQPEPAGDVYAEITAEPAADLLVRMGTNGQRWAQGFIATARRLIDGEDGAGSWSVRAVLDEGWLIGWFANAIEAGRTAEQQQPYTPPADTGDRETRLINRMCRCSQPLTELVRRCLWHDAGSAQYARDLLAEVRRLQVAVGPLQDRIDRSLPADDGRPFTAGYAQGLMDVSLWIRQAFPLSGADG